MNRKVVSGTFVKNDQVLANCKALMELMVELLGGNQNLCPLGLKFNFHS